jgi:putative oxidoreductase
MPNCAGFLHLQVRGTPTHVVGSPVDDVSRFMRLTMWEAVYAVARVGLTILFVLAGLRKFINIDGIAGTLTTKGFPEPLTFAYLVAAVELIGGLLVAVGWKTRSAALLLFAFTAGTILVSHDFWVMEDAARAMNQTQALKNLSIMAGFLMVAAIGGGRWSVDGWENGREGRALPSPEAARRG